MRTIVKGKSIEIPEQDRDYAERKLLRIERLVGDSTDATVELWTEQRKSAADSHIAEISVMIEGHPILSRASGASYKEALDDVIDKIERMVVDHKE